TRKASERRRLHSTRAKRCCEASARKSSQAQREVRRKSKRRRQNVAEEVFVIYSPQSVSLAASIDLSPRVHLHGTPLRHSSVARLAVKRPSFITGIFFIDGNETHRPAALQAWQICNFMRIRSVLSS